jgi:hypothetical protein
MNATSFKSTDFSANSLFYINHELSGWDLKPVVGKGLVAKFTGGDKYAFIEIKVYKAQSQSSIVWNISELQIPSNFGHKPYIEKALAFFLQYLSGIKGTHIDLTFEINDIGFHLVDTAPKHFCQALMVALVNCFKKNFFPINDQLVADMKIKALDYSKMSGKFFFKEQILESLKNLEITDRLGKIFNKEYISINNLQSDNFNGYLGDLFNQRVSKMDVNFLDYLKRENVVSEFNELTDIGKAHIAKSLDDFYDLYYNFNISRADL